MSKLEHCLACATELTTVTLGEYARCTTCGSYCYVSGSSAHDDNVAYFERRDVWEVTDDDVKGRMLTALRRVSHVMNLKAWFKLRDLERRVEQLCLNSPSLLEVGFGDGSFLTRLLDKGVEIHGIDLSQTAVTQFRSRYPQYANRVQRTTQIEGEYSLIYAIALFEHLDDPSSFLSNVIETLVPDGLLVLGLPMVSRARASISLEQDINFWKPCHRVIYSLEGLHSLLSRHGFILTQHASFDQYNYRVMNVMLKNGHDWVHEYRTPLARVPSAPSRLGFMTYLVKAMLVRSVSVWAQIVAKRC